MSNQELIKYGKEHGLYGLSSKEVERANSRYYHTIRARGLAEKVFKKEKAEWKKMSDEELIEYAKKRGLFGLSPTEVINKAGGYYNEVNDRNLTHEIFTKKVKNWNNMGDMELIKYGKEHGLYGLSSKEVQDVDSKYYHVIRKRGLTKEIFSLKKVANRHLDEMTDNEIIKYGKNHGLFGLTPTEGYKKDKRYYVEVLNRKLIDEVFNRRQIRIGNIIDLLRINQAAKTVASLAAINGYTSEVAHILAQEWPERFPSYEEAMRRLPQIVPRIVSALQPISLIGSGRPLESLFDYDFRPQTRRDLSDVLYQIGLQEYQKPFSDNPKRTLAQLEQKIERANNRELSQLYRKIYRFYQDTFSFSIPGYGSLATR